MRKEADIHLFRKQKEADIHFFQKQADTHSFQFANPWMVAGEIVGV
jgi:hypothetical protein